MRRRSCLALAGAGLVSRAMSATGSNPMVELRTPKGIVLLVLFPRQAPASAGGFLSVVAAGAYGGGAFARVVRPDNDHGHPTISVIQGAARKGTTAAPKIRHETTRDTGLRHQDGTISLTRDAVGTATGGEFFICVGDQPALDFGGMRNPDGQGFAAFGRVIHGMGVVRRIWREDASGPSTEAYTAGQMLARPVPFLSARRV